MAETLTALEDPLLLGGRTLQSRLLVGTGGFSSLAVLSEAVASTIQESLEACGPPPGMLPAG